MNESIKFLSSNLISAASELAASSGSSALINLLDRSNATEWTSEGSSEGVAATITWTPPTGTDVSRIIVVGCNWKTFTIKYDTTSTFTPAINESDNADENLIYEVALQNVTNIVFSCSNTMAAVADKVAAQIIICTEQMECAYNTNNYEPEIADVAGKVFDMLDGGVKMAVVRDIFDVELEWKFVENAEYLKFKALYNLRSSFLFVPEPNAAAWDGKCYDVIIIEGWFGEKYSKPYRPDGRDIKIHIRETGL